MDKFASDAYSQGAYDALQSMNVPQHIKVAAAQYMTKEAKIPNSLRVGARNVSGRLKEILSGGGAQQRASRQMFSPLPGANKINVIPSQEAVAEAAKSIRNDRILAGIVGTGLIGGGGLYAGGAFDDDEPAPLPQDFLSRAQRGDLTNTELALAAGGLGAVGLGGAYAADLI